MANVTETPSYDAGIYQIETTDPVLGGHNGIANAQAKGLANRTAFLKQQIDQLNSGQLTPAWIASQDYVQGELKKLDAKQSVRAATTANITLSGVQTIDGVALTVGDRVLVKDQTAAAQNGIYLVTAQSWARATDADDGTKLSSGSRIAVEVGMVNAGKVWYLANIGAISIGTSVLEFVDEHASATETVSGMMKVATQAQANAGASDDAAVTPKKLKEALRSIGITVCGSALIGVPIDWPLAQMPQDVWPDCGMVFLSCAGQSFNKSTYPAAAQLYPDGVMPEIRGEFIRGWDNGRGVDPGRQLLSAQAATQLPSIYTYAASAATGVLVTPPINTYQGSYPIEKSATDYESATTGAGQYYSTTQQLAPYGSASLSTFRVRVRSSAFHKIMRVA